MLDTDTRRRIDTARDILVGKVPDPKSQVEQITIALIYKFMDDMDAESEEFGGVRKFFAGDFSRYGWAKLMHAGLGGNEILNLYAEAIARMPENPGIPLLFRSIFKNAYLPYRDPETLKMFLKVIDEFEYDHSERLGDAFEYLLSVLGSQGDAGQFRTPRHIIDFIVEVVDPKKDETLLDPACGTAGFLISSYKHILKANTDARGHSTLSPEEKGRLAQNFTGYDISPDMVRLSLVNMYLHGFADPHIYEYDTLTSQDRWNEYADVILANPPFMSPKGGIQPHNRFSVQSKRSEVLFVDYMAEHLTPNGRAGIIVPEGIIFQSGTAYKQLRKLLVEDFLVAVISLPQGVFNPYSGVKTSILILDRPRAKRSSEVLFVRIDDDGHDLGATRKRTGDGDLPEALHSLRDWFRAIDDGDSLVDSQPSTARSLLVPRQEIAASGDYRLSADTYRKIKNGAGSGFPWVPLGELLGPRSSSRVGDDLTLPILSITMKHGLVDQSDKFKRRIASADISGYKKVAQYELVVGFPIDEGVLGIQTLYPFAAVSPAYDVWTVNLDGLDLSFFELLLRSQQARSRYRLKMRGTAGRRRVLDKAEFLEIEFPLPSLDVQREIVAEIEGYQKVIDGARAVVDNYRPYIAIHPDWPMVELGEICSFKNGINYTKGASGNSLKIIGVRSFQNNLCAPLADLDEVFLNDKLGDEYLVKTGDILFVRSNGNPDLVGRSIIVSDTTERITFSGFTIRGRIEDARAMPLFYALFFKSRDFAERMKTVGRGANIRNLSQSILQELRVPLPPLAAQKAIVAEIEAEQALVNANRELIARFEKKIHATLARVWGE